MYFQAEAIGMSYFYNVSVDSSHLDNLRHLL